MVCAPDPVLRPRLALFLFERDLTYRDAAEPLQTTHETLRRICLPFSDPGRRVPQRALMGRIVAWTGGEVVPNDFYAPVLRAALAS